jgi:(1->4)-alpha-D-glucan 1-alpha-D-glucosylmutase
VSGRRLDGGRVSVAALLADYPVAILAPASTAADITPGS